MVSGLALTAGSVWFGVQGLRFSDGLECWVKGLGLRVKGLGCRV